MRVSFTISDNIVELAAVVRSGAIFRKIGFGLALSRFLVCSSFKISVNGAFFTAGNHANPVYWASLHLLQNNLPPHRTIPETDQVVGKRLLVRVSLFLPIFPPTRIFDFRFASFAAATATPLLLKSHPVNERLVFFSNGIALACHFQAAGAASPCQFR